MAADPNPESEEPREHRKLMRAVQALRKAQVCGEKNDIRFAVDEKTHLTVIRIVDRETGEVVQQLPAEYVLRLAAPDSFQRNNP